MMPVTVLAPLYPPQSRTRIAKFLALARTRGVQTTFLGWQRDVPFSLRRTGSAHEARLLRGGRYGAGRAAIPFYLLWMVKVFWATVGASSGTYYALGFESAFPVAIANRVRRRRHCVVFDDADRFSILFPLPSPLARGIGVLERWTQRACDIHVVPNINRYPDGLHANRTVVLPNVPSCNDVDAAKDRRPILPPRRPKALRVYLNGWLGHERGLDTAIAAAALCAADRRIAFIAAGRALEADVLRLTAADIHYLGIIDGVDALALYREVDVAVTMYAPTTTINRYAEANKWGDCLAMCCPFIVNEEVVTAVSYVQAGFAFSVPYDGGLALAKLLMTLSENPQLVEEARKRLNENAQRVPCYEDLVTSQVIEPLSR